MFHRREMTGQAEASFPRMSSHQPQCASLFPDFAPRRQDVDVLRQKSSDVQSPSLPHRRRSPTAEVENGTDVVQGRADRVRDRDHHRQSSGMDMRTPLGPRTSFMIDDILGDKGETSSQNGEQPGTEAVRVQLRQSTKTVDEKSEASPTVRDARERQQVDLPLPSPQNFDRKLLPNENYPNSGDRRPMPISDVDGDRRQTTPVKRHSIQSVDFSNDEERNCRKSPTNLRPFRPPQNSADVGGRFRLGAARSAAPGPEVPVAPFRPHPDLFAPRPNFVAMSSAEHRLSSTSGGKPAVDYTQHPHLPNRLHQGPVSQWTPPFLHQTPQHVGGLAVTHQHFAQLGQFNAAHGSVLSHLPPSAFGAVLRSTEYGLFGRQNAFLHSCTFIFSIILRPTAFVDIREQLKLIRVEVYLSNSFISSCFNQPTSLHLSN